MKIAANSAEHVLRFRKLSFLFVSGWICHSKDQSFQFAQVTIFNGEINTETIPRFMMSVLKVVSQTCNQVACKTHIVEFTAAEEGIDSLTMTDILPDDLLMLFQHPARNILQVLGY